jgi:hypothetical protein
MRLFDTFDSYISGNFDDGHVQPRWDAFQHSSGNSGWGPTSGAIPSTRFGVGHGFQFGGGDYLTKNTPGNPSRMVVGTAFLDVTPGSQICMFTFWDGATRQLSIAKDADGSITARRGTIGAGTVVAQYSPGSSTKWAVYQFIEFDITFHASAGIVDIWVEGTRVVHATGLNTAASGTGQITKFTFGQNDTGGNFLRYDDMYALDTTDAAPWNARLGDVRGYLLTPSGAGSLTQMTPDAGSNYQRVASDDDDTSYVATSTVGNADLYAQSDLPGGFAGTIYGIAHTTRWRKDDAGVRTAAQLLKSGATTVQGADVTLVSSYANDTEFAFVDPNTTAAWTATNVNAIESGAKMTA